ncbi:MAG: DUF4357 domain-containing protein [Candidatus Peribacteria bacterium]|nr:MAG: DUF4357 domain-containing protein [Candidatus Peribacteria bacterium]
MIFLENHLFASPSRASCIVLGRASNGRTERKDNNGKTLDENERQ